MAPNLLDRQVFPDAPGRAWVADISYIPTDEGWLFLAVVLDLFADIEGYYNRRRLHSALDTITPEQAELCAA